MSKIDNKKKSKYQTKDDTEKNCDKLSTDITTMFYQLANTTTE
jgi:hypothetical protein